MKDILIIAEFCGDFSETDNIRFLYLANMFSKQHRVEIVTSRFWHITKKERGKIIKKWPFKITLIDEPGYPRNICLRRFYSHIKWGNNVLEYLKRRKRPDIIYCAVPSLTAARNAAFFCKKNKIRFVIDIQDLWPEAFKMVFGIPLISDILFLPFTIVADSIYRRADDICAVSRTYAARAMRVNKKCHNPTVVYLGTDLRVFDQYSKGNRMLSLPTKKKGIWIGYCGSLGNSYDIDTVIDALCIIKKKYDKHPTLIVMGDGSEKKRLKTKAEKSEVDALFLGRLPYNEMCEVLSMCDMVVNPIKKKSAASIINKHGDYAAAGIPVLNLQESNEYMDLVNSYKMGVNCRNGDSRDLANRIELLANNENLRKQMGRNARRCAEEYFDRSNTYRKIVRLVFSSEGN